MQVRWREHCFGIPFAGFTGCIPGSSSKTTFAMYSSHSAPPFRSTSHQSTVGTEILLPNSTFTPPILTQCHIVSRQERSKGAHPHLAQHLVSPATTPFSPPNHSIDSHGLFARDTSITLRQNLALVTQNSIGQLARCICFLLVWRVVSDQRVYRTCRFE
jgi:hypothetical protein